jgi:3,4-dihydroxy 2-butanone 4-phosphate synthase/GTP cyclohydrolase II
VFSPIPEILAELRQGRMIVLTDDENRENEGDLLLPAQFITAEAVNFMVREAGGYLFLSLPEEDCDRLNLHGQSAVNTSARGTPLTVSIDGHPKHGFTTGVAAAERARTIKLAIDPRSGPDDFVRPGHINPLRSRTGGVLVRTGHTEGLVDLCRLAGLHPGAVGIEVCRPDGAMARVPDLEKFCERHGLKMTSIAQLIEYRLSRESLVRRIEPVSGIPVRTAHGTFTAIAFESLVDALPHIALTMGDVGRLDAAGRAIESSEPTLVRVHRKSVLGDVFGALDPSGDSSGDRSSQGSTSDTLRASMAVIARAGRGAVVYLRPEGIGHGFDARLDAIRRPGHTPGADAPGLPSPGESGTERYIGIGSQILRALGLSKLRLLTNHPTDFPGLEAFGLEVVERVPVRA